MPFRPRNALTGPVARGPAARRALPRAQAATWAWAGKVLDRLGQKPARSIATVCRDPTVVHRFRRDKNPVGRRPPENPSLISLLPISLSAENGSGGGDRGGRRPP